jgi:hypothetical protein
MFHIPCAERSAHLRTTMQRAAEMIASGQLTLLPRCSPTTDRNWTGFISRPMPRNLFRKATGEGRESVLAAILWLKTRASWKETAIQEVAGERHVVFTFASDASEARRRAPAERNDVIRATDQRGRLLRPSRRWLALF